MSSHEKKKKGLAKAAKALALVSGTTLVGNYTIFQSFAVAAMWNDTEWNNFLNTTRNAEKNKTQQLIQNTHTNYTQHADGSYHSDNTPHSDGNPHSDTPHSDASAPHSDTQHNNVSRPHSDVTTDTYPNHNQHSHYMYHGHHPNEGSYVQHKDEHSDTVHDNTTISTKHTDTPYSHTDVGHSDATPHSDSTHSDSAPHADYYQFSQAYPHSDAYPHNNTGFDHQNYVPSKPEIYNLPQNQQLAGFVKIGMYSYDKNFDGAGSQDSYSKTALYDLSIRKIKNIDGTISTSAWKILISGQPAATADKGYSYDINSLDPLGVGNTNLKASEGYYEVKAVAKNVLSNGVVHQSPDQIVTIKIQNTSPEISVTNGNEFINFTFGFDGALDPGLAAKKYLNNMYSGASPAQQEGILIRVKMKDPDNGATTGQNWQLGKVYLKKSTGVLVTTADVVWENGSTVIESANQDKMGYAFIPRASYLGSGDLDSAKIFLEVKDYLDAACTKPSGTTISQTTISNTNATLLVVNVDATPVPGTIKINGGAASTNNANVTLNFTKTFNGKWADVDKILVSNDPTFGTYQEFNYADTINGWQIDRSNTSATVYAKYKDTVGNINPTAFTASINYTGPIMYFGEVEHNQLINIVTQNGAVEIALKDPNTLDDGYTMPAGQSLSSWNTFEDMAPVKYRLEFEVESKTTADKIKDMDIDMLFNATGLSNVRLDMKGVELKKEVGGDYQTLASNLAYTSSGQNRYKTSVGSVISTNGAGRYAIEYRGLLYVGTGTVMSQTMRNNATLTVYTGAGKTGPSVEGADSTHKTYIDTKITRKTIEYR